MNNEKSVPNVTNKQSKTRMTTAQYRHMIETQRMDDLDRATLDFIKLKQDEVKERSVQIMEFGGRYGAHTKRMSVAGADITMIDLIDLHGKYFSSCGHDGKTFGAINHIQKNFLDINAQDIPNPLDIIYSQRALNYIPYADLLKLLNNLFQHLESDGAIFLSLAGKDTEYGKTQIVRDNDIADRHGMIAPQMQEKHKIFVPITVYDMDDIKLLLSKVGFKDIQTAQSDFGNVKAIGFKSGRPTAFVATLD